MPATWTIDGLYHWNRAAVGQDPDSLPLTVHLFQNDYTPVLGSVLSDFDEADFTGYGPIDGYGNTAGSVTGGVMVSQYRDTHGGLLVTPFIFTVSAIPIVGNTIYGYYVTWFDTVATDYVLFARRFTSPQDLTLGGAFVSFSLNITLRQH